jgi:hypothetical protein
MQSEFIFIHGICLLAAQYLRSCLKLSEDPCQDFFAFSCGNFRTFSPVINGSMSWGPFEIADNATNHAIRGKQRACNAMWTYGYVSSFQRNILPPFSRLK